MLARLCITGFIHENTEPHDGQQTLAIPPALQVRTVSKKKTTGLGSCS